MSSKPFAVVALSTHVRAGQLGPLALSQPLRMLVACTVSRSTTALSSFGQQRFNSTLGNEARKANYHELKQFIQYKYVPTLFNPNKSLSDFFHAYQDKFDQHIALRIFPSTIGIIPHFKGMLYYKSLLITGKLLVLNNGSTRKLTKAFFQKQFEHFSEGDSKHSSGNTVNESCREKPLQEAQNNERDSLPFGQTDLKEDQEKVKLKILQVEELFMGSNNKGKCLDYNVQDTVSDKLVIKWELNLPGFDTSKQIPTSSASDSASNIVNRGKANASDFAAGSNEKPEGFSSNGSASDSPAVRKKQCITGLFIFEFNPDNTKISVHTIDHVVFDNDKENKKQDSVNLLFF
ncbi:hypothetical protein ACO0RG_003429 [Hanseniaspora osmophila]